MVLGISPYEPMVATTPFTTRDNISYLQKLNLIRDKLNELIANVELNDAELIESLNEDFAALNAQWNAELYVVRNEVIQQLSTPGTPAHDAVLDAAGSVYDPATANLVTDGNSATGTALNTMFVTKGVPKSLADFGVLPGNTAAQNRAGFIAAAQSTYTNFVLPAGTYQWSMANAGDWMMTFTNKSGIVIRGLGAVINDTSNYSNNGPLEGLFLVDNCKDFTLSGIEYVGPALATPNTLHGYQGATLVSAVNGTTNVNVDVRATNCRYAVQSGDYANGSRGQCSGFTIRVRGTMIGYPVALYYASNATLDIDVTGVHRAAYLAGVDGCSGTVRFKNTYIAPVACLLTDALVSSTDALAQANPVGAATSSIGCSNIDLTVVDKGSTTYVADTYCAGISLSRVDPGTSFRNINVRVYVKSTNTVSTTIHGFAVTSNANAIWNRYPFNWETSILLENIKVSGVIDKGDTTVAVTAGGTNGPIIIRSDDPSSVTHCASIRNLSISDLLVKRGTQSYSAPVYVRGLQTPMKIDGFVFVTNADVPTGILTLVGNTTQPVVFTQSRFSTLDVTQDPTTNVVLGANTVVTSLSGDAAFTAEGGRVHGVGPRQRTSVITTDLSGAAVTLTNAIPAGAVDVRVQARVITAITGATGFQIGVASDLTRFADVAGTGTGNLAQPYTHAASAFTAAPTAGAQNLVITGKTSAFTGGRLRVAITYWDYSTVTAA